MPFQRRPTLRNNQKKSPHIQLSLTILGFPMADAGLGWLSLEASSTLLLHLVRETIKAYPQDYSDHVKGLLNSFGTFQARYVETWDLNTSTITWIGSVQVCFLVYVANVPLADRSIAIRSLLWWYYCWAGI